MLLPCSFSLVVNPGHKVNGYIYYLRSKTTDGCSRQDIPLRDAIHVHERNKHGGLKLKLLPFILN